MGRINHCGPDWTASDGWLGQVRLQANPKISSNVSTYRTKRAKFDIHNVIFLFGVMQSGKNETLHQPFQWWYTTLPYLSAPFNNGTTVFILLFLWELCFHWLKILWQLQVAVHRHGQMAPYVSGRLGTFRQFAQTRISRSPPRWTSGEHISCFHSMRHFIRDRTCM